MANKNLSAKDFAQVANMAKNEIKGTFTSPFVIINQLNKAAKGDFTKIENCSNLSRENVAQVAKQVKMLHAGRYPFVIDILPRAEYNGRIGWWNEVPAQQGELASLLAGETVLCTDPKFVGRELCTQNGKVGVFRPVPLNVNAIFNAYCIIVRQKLRSTEQAAKQAEREAKQAAKQAEKVAKAKKIVTAVFGELANTFSEAEILSKAAIIKAAK